MSGGHSYELRPFGLLFSSLPLELSDPPLTLVGEGGREGGREGEGGRRREGWREGGKEREGEGERGRERKEGGREGGREK